MRWAAVPVGAMILLAGCASTVPASTPSPSLASARAVSSTTAEQLCRDRFGDELAAWSRITLTAAALRATTWGPARHPLATAFAGVPDDAAGAWCGTRLASGTRWWAVVAGQESRRVVDITGAARPGPGPGPVVR